MKKDRGRARLMANSYRIVSQILCNMYRTNVLAEMLEEGVFRSFAVFSQTDLTR